MKNKSTEKIIFYEDISKKQIDKKLPMFNKEDFVPETQKDAMKNPFLNFGEDVHNYNTIEEFGLCYKKRNIYVGSIIRNQELSKRLKIKILKKYLRKQKKDYKEQIKNLKLKHSSTNNQIRLVEIKKTKFKYILLMFILIILNMLLVTIFTGKFWNLELNKLISNKLINKISNNLNELLSNKLWLQILLILSFASIIIILVYYMIYKIIIKRYTRKKKRYQDGFDIKIKQTNKCFVSEYQKVKRFYLKRIKEEKIYYEALELVRLWNLDTSLNDFNDEKESLEKTTNKISTYLKIDKIIRILLILICLITNIFLFIIVIIGGFKSL